MRRKSMPFAVGILVAAIVAACGGGPTPSSNNGLLTEQNAIEQAVEYLKRPAPEITGVENPRNPVAWRMTLGEYHQRTGISPSSEGADTPVWVVHIEGESSSAGIVPPESRKTYRYAVAVLDARTGNVIATRHSNEPLAWPTATDAPSMSDPSRMVRETPGPTVPPGEPPEAGTGENMLESPTPVPPWPTVPPEASGQGRVVVAVNEYSVVEQVKIQRFPGSTVTPTAGYLFLIVKVRLRNNTAEEIQTTIDVSATHDGIALMGLREGRFYDVPTLDATSRGNTRRLSPDGELPNEIVAFEIPQNTGPKDVTLHFQIVWSVTQTTDITLNESTGSASRSPTSSTLSPQMTREPKQWFNSPFISPHSRLLKKGVQRGKAPAPALSEAEGVGVWGYPPDMTFTPFLARACPE